MIQIIKKMEAFFMGRGIKLCPPPSLLSINNLINNYGIYSYSWHLEMCKTMGGFNDDYDQISMLTLWKLENIISYFDDYGPRGLVPFADFSFGSEVYCYSARPNGNLIWSELEQRWLKTTVKEFFINWMKGRYDDGVGIVLSP